MISTNIRSSMLLKIIKNVAVFALFLIYIFLLVLLIWISARIVSGNLPVVFIDERFMRILVLPITILSPAIYLLIKKKKLTRRFILVWFLITVIVIIPVWIYLKKYRPGLTLKIRNYCQKFAKEEGEREARKKGYFPGSDTYFVVSKLTKERVYGECLYQNGLSRQKLNGWTFDWLPDASTDFQEK